MSIVPLTFFPRTNFHNVLKQSRKFVVYVSGAALIVLSAVVAIAQQTKPLFRTPLPASSAIGATRNAYVGNEACAGCHSSIYNSYKQTPMAHASGPAMENLIPADFTHRQSGVHYHIYADSGRVWLSFDRDGDRPLHGKRELLYYIGSGRRGLTYLFKNDDFVFESPINWYGDRHEWDMTPAYQNATEVPLNLPAYASCLHCHVSGMQAPFDGTENRYPMTLLTHSGVTCERCHGPGAVHMKSGPIVNPAKLSADRRDAICMQCHMEGRVSIERPGRHIYEFRPGDSLSDYIRYYVPAGSSSELGAVSQVEAFAQSTCKKASGDTMSCTSCHDPHFSPSTQDRVAYFRKKCLACHGEAFGEKHHNKKKDCTACHMPASPSKDVAHTEVTDHRIPRLANVSPQLPRNTAASSEKPALVPFPESQEADGDLRDMALAWESFANREVEAVRGQAEEMLRRSAAQFPNDAATLSALAYEEQTHGDINGARKLYRRALAADPNLIDAATNLGVIEAQSGNLATSIDLLRGAFERAPARSDVGMDLAEVFCVAGKLDEGRTTLVRMLEFNPDMAAAKIFLEGLKAPQPKCSAR